MFFARKTPRCLNTQSLNARAKSSLPDLGILEDQADDWGRKAIEEELLFSIGGLDGTLEEVVAKKIH